MTVEGIRNMDGGRKELRKFGLTMGIVLGLLGGLWWWRANPYYSYLFILSIAFLLLGLAVPMLLKPVHKIWMTLAVLMGWLMTRVLLSILFFLVFTPMGLVARLFGKQFLDLKIDKKKRSYWNYREAREFKKIEYESQF